MYLVHGVCKELSERCFIAKDVNTKLSIHEGILPDALPETEELKTRLDQIKEKV